MTAAGAGAQEWPEVRRWPEMLRDGVAGWPKVPTVLKVLKVLKVLMWLGC
jgi:hypothetical protein